MTGSTSCVANVHAVAVDDAGGVDDPLSSIFNST